MSDNFLYLDCKFKLYFLQNLAETITNPQVPNFTDKFFSKRNAKERAQNIIFLIGKVAGQYGHESTEVSRTALQMASDIIPYVCVDDSEVRWWYPDIVTNKDLGNPKKKMIHNYGVDVLKLMGLYLLSEPASLTYNPASLVILLLSGTLKQQIPSLEEIDKSGILSEKIGRIYENGGTVLLPHRFFRGPWEVCLAPGGQIIEARTCSEILPTEVQHCTATEYVLSCLSPNPDER